MAFSVREKSSANGSAVAGYRLRLKRSEENLNQAISLEELEKRSISGISGFPEEAELSDKQRESLKEMVSPFRVDPFELERVLITLALVKNEKKILEDVA